MNANPLISVIVPVFNVEPYIKKCLDSIVNQTYKNLEIILVDDGSTDNSGKICDEYAALDNRVIVIHKENGGLSSARNAGLDICNGEYIGFIDSDDWIDEGMYLVMLSAMKAESVLISCCGRNDVTDGVAKIGLCPSKNEVIDSNEAIKRILVWDNIDSSACDKLFHKTIWHHFRFPDGRISEDVAIMYKIIDSAEKIVLVAEPFYNYFHRRGSITTAEFNFKKLDLIKNIDEMECFFADKYSTLDKEFGYFKFVEFSHLASLLALDASRNYVQLEKQVCANLKACDTSLARLTFKGKIKLFMQKNYFAYKAIYKPFIQFKKRFKK